MMSASTMIPTLIRPLDILGRLHAFLPEPVPNRAEALEGLDLARWLRSVVASDGSGFTVLTGGGTTFTLLYAGGVPIAASLSSYETDAFGAEALSQLLGRGQFNVFALTYVCEAAVARALSSLFGPGGPRLALDTDPRALAACLTAARGERATGALLVEAGDDAWSVLLLADGVVVAGYGADDRSLKPGIDDATILLHLDQLWATRLSPHGEDLSAALAVSGMLDTGPLTDGSILEIETALIGLLAKLEHQLTSASAAPNRQSLVIDAFLSIHVDLDLQPAPPTVGEPFAFIPSALGVSDFIDGFERRIEDYVDWLARSDEASARYLHDAASELALQARAIVRR